MLSGFERVVICERCSSLFYWYEESVNCANEYGRYYFYGDPEGMEGKLDDIQARYNRAMTATKKSIAKQCTCND